MNNCFNLSLFLMAQKHTPCPVKTGRLSDTKPDFCFATNINNLHHLLYNLGSLQRIKTICTVRNIKFVNQK